MVVEVVEEVDEFCVVVLWELFVVELVVELDCVAELEVVVPEVCE